MFPCTVCGECCRRVDHADETRWLDRGDGLCRYFDEKLMLCSIYDVRPAICNIEVMYNSRYSGNMTKLDFYRLNAECCNLMQENSNVDKKYRIYNIS